MGAREFNGSPMARRNVKMTPPHRAVWQRWLAAGSCGDENREAVHRAWRLHYGHIQQFRLYPQDGYQGWDLHPAQPPTAATAAVVSPFLAGFDRLAARIEEFLLKKWLRLRWWAIAPTTPPCARPAEFFPACDGLPERSAKAEAERLTGVTTEVELRSGSSLKILMNQQRNSVVSS